MKPKNKRGGVNLCLKELFVHINESDMIDVADTYNTPVLRGQRSRSKVKVTHKKKGGGVFISSVFVKSMKLKGELLPERDVGPFWDQ